MTTICASRQHGEMAADTQVTAGNSSFPAKKIVATQHGLVGAAGTCLDCTSFFKWVDAGMPDERPSLVDGDSFQALVLSHDGLFYVEEDLALQRIERDFHAIGSGGASALAAMICGKTPKRAVEIASKVDACTGGPITVLKL